MTIGECARMVGYRRQERLTVRHGLVDAAGRQLLVREPPTYRTLKPWPNNQAITRASVDHKISKISKGVCGMWAKTTKAATKTATVPARPAMPHACLQPSIQGITAKGTFPSATKTAKTTTISLGWSIIPTVLGSTHPPISPATKSATPSAKTAMIPAILPLPTRHLPRHTPTRAIVCQALAGFRGAKRQLPANCLPNACRAPATGHRPRLQPLAPLAARSDPNPEYSRPHTHHRSPCTSQKRLLDE